MVSIFQNDHSLPDSNGDVRCHNFHHLVCYGVHFGPLQCSTISKPNPIQQFATSLTVIQELTKWNHTHCYLPTTRHQRHSHLYHFYFSHLPDTSLPNVDIFYFVNFLLDVSNTYKHKIFTYSQFQSSKHPVLYTAAASLFCG